jgi:hypothetical protein
MPRRWERGRDGLPSRSGANRLHSAGGLARGRADLRLQRRLAGAVVRQRRRRSTGPLGGVARGCGGQPRLLRQHPCGCGGGSWDVHLEPQAPLICVGHGQLRWVGKHAHTHTVGQRSARNTQRAQERARGHRTPGTVGQDQGACAQRQASQGVEASPRRTPGTKAQGVSFWVALARESAAQRHMSRLASSSRP